MSTQDAFPPPLVVEPLSGAHKHTVILLHGRGRTAEDLAAGVLGKTVAHRGWCPAAEQQQQQQQQQQREDEEEKEGEEGDKEEGEVTVATLGQRLPHARFVFPRAPRGRATVYRRSVVRQWFDDWHLRRRREAQTAEDVVDAGYDEGLQTGGLGRSVAYLHGLVGEEAAALGGGAQKVVVGGFSQGAATSLVAALLWEEGRGVLGGVVALGAWLPYGGQLMMMMMGDGARGGLKADEDEDEEEDEEELDPFERDHEAPARDERGGSVRDAALAWLRDEIELAPTAPQQQPPGYEGEEEGAAAAAGGGGRMRTPVMLCHGLDDVKVVPGRSEEAARVLSALGGCGPVLRKTYAGAGHDFADRNMLSDVGEFLGRCSAGHDCSNVRRAAGPCSHG